MRLRFALGRGLFLLFAGWLALFMGPTHLVAAQGTPLEQAAKSGAITIKINGRSPAFIEPMIIVNITNEYVAPLSLDARQGLMLHSQIDKHSDIILARDVMIELQPNQTKQVELYAYTVDPDKAFPTPSVAYTPTTMSNDLALTAVLNRINSAGMRNELAGQLAVWMQITGLNFDRLVVELDSPVNLEIHRELTLLLYSGSPLQIRWLTLGGSTWWLILGGVLVVGVALFFFIRALNLNMLGRKYQILERIHIGQRYEIYHARRLLAFDREKVVIKLPVHETDVLHCEREIEARKKIHSHLNIVPLLDSGHDKLKNWLFPRPYLVEPFIEGCNLEEFMQDHAPLSMNTILEIVAEIVDALIYIHERGLVHRYLMPKNILVDKSGTVRIAGFRAMQEAELSSYNLKDTFLHTSGNWLAPELLNGTSLYQNGQPATGEAASNLGGSPADVRSDIYAVGLIMYWMSSGKRPFAHNILSLDESSQQPLLQFDRAVPAHIQTAILCCLHGEPAERFQNALKLKQALQLPTPPNNKLETVQSELAHIMHAV